MHRRSDTRPYLLQALSNGVVLAVMGLIITVFTTFQYGWAWGLTALAFAVVVLIGSFFLWRKDHPELPVLEFFTGIFHGDRSGGIFDLDEPTAESNRKLKEEMLQLSAEITRFLADQTRNTPLRDYSPPYTQRITDKYLLSGKRRKEVEMHQKAIQEADRKHLLQVQALFEERFCARIDDLYGRLATTGRRLKGSDSCAYAISMGHTMRQTAKRLREYAQKL